MEKLCLKDIVQKEDTLFKCILYLRTQREYLSQVCWMRDIGASPCMEI